MSTLVSLLKATMSGGIVLFDYRGKTERSRRVMPLLLASLIGIAMLFSASAMAGELKQEGGTTTVLSLYTLITVIIIVTEGVYKSGDLLFSPKDNDMLLAMPIKKPTIVLVRMIKFYVFEMIYCLIFLLPAIIAYAVNADVEPSFYLVAPTMLLLVPVIPIVISCVVGLGISEIAVRFRHRAFWQVILSFVALFVILTVILTANMNSGFNNGSMIMIGEKINTFYYPAAAFTRLATNFDIWEYLLFVAVNLTLAIVAVLLISRFYFQMVTRVSAVKRGQNTVLKYHFRKHGQVCAIVRKEMSRYFSTPVLLTNTALGLVLFLVAVGALCFNYDSIVASITGSVENFPLSLDEIWGYLPSVAFILVAFASLMTFITATTISLEGKAFNLLKTLPISGRKVIFSKVLAAMILIVPFTLIGSIVMMVRFRFDILSGILVLIAAIAMPLVTELIGILINLKYARFDAENDAVVVRQSAGVMVATFLGLGMVLITASMTFAVVFLAGQTVGLLMMDAIFVIMALYLCLAAVTRGEERYTKLSA